METMAQAFSDVDMDLQAFTLKSSEIYSSLQVLLASMADAQGKFDGLTNSAGKLDVKLASMESSAGEAEQTLQRVTEVCDWMGYTTSANIKFSSRESAESMALKTLNTSIC